MTTRRSRDIMQTMIEPKLSNNRIQHYLKLAKSACYYSDNRRTRLGCVIVYKGKILSVGYNLQDKTNPLQKKFNQYREFDPNASGCKNSIHAECHALLKIKDLDIDWRKSNVFVWRIKKDGTRGMARPCPACEAMLKNQGISRVYYSTDNGWGYEEYDG